MALTKIGYTLIKDSFKDAVSGSDTEHSSSYSTRVTTLENANISGGFVAQTVLSGSGTIFSGSATSTATFANYGGNVSGSASSTGSFGRVEATKLSGDGSDITGLATAAITSISNSAANQILTDDGDSTATAEHTLTFDANVLTITGDILPGTSIAYDLGSAAYKWANIYTADLHLEGTNIVDNTEGNWTLQEGENDIYLLNNKKEKVYRIKLEEIE